ncbi:MAG: hypothetical protein K1X86_09220 [Ignavibacteria bacterium]|nr:hypothetical protein [Ignavibacteria bacterium]
MNILNSNQADYILIGGYAINIYGYSRPTGDIDIWVKMDYDNSLKIRQSLVDFGFDEKSIQSNFFTQKNKMLRIGFSPLRIELITTISGVDYDECFKNSIIQLLDGVEVRVISLQDLKKNKKASGRLKDLNDLENLE